MSKRIVCVSDLHENLPEIPECDILCIAGDVTFGFKGDFASQHRWLVNDFYDWCRGVPAKHVVVVAGNHDQSVEQWGWPLDDDGRIHYLEDSGIRLEGLNIWGTPWQPWFYNWAYNAPFRNGEDFLAEKFAMIPPDTDIVICHGPPLGHGDQVGDPNVPDRSGQPRVGSKAMTERLEELQPRLMVCGHIHSGRGVFQLGHTKIVNAAIVNNKYQPIYEPVLVHVS
jgi:Icc-related predicted phosphoesterase